MTRYRLFVRLYQPTKPPVKFLGACSCDGRGVVVDLDGLPCDVLAAVVSGISKDGRQGGGTQLQHGRYVTYAARLNRAELPEEAA